MAICGFGIDIRSNETINKMLSKIEHVELALASKAFFTAVKT